MVASPCDTCDTNIGDVQFMAGPGINHLRGYPEQIKLVINRNKNIRLVLIFSKARTRFYHMLNTFEKPIQSIMYNICTIRRYHVIFI